jgi:hypothetical protein
MKHVPEDLSSASSDLEFSSNDGRGVIRCSTFLPRPTPSQGFVFEG